VATALDIINEWAADIEEKQTVGKGLRLRWLNQAQLRYAARSEMLRSEWQPTVPASGNIALVTDFLREFPYLVKREVGETLKYPLLKIDYWKAINLTFVTVSTHYSIFNGKLYVWAPGALTPSIPYVKKPAVITDLDTSNLEIPSEFHYQLIPYLDAKFERYKGRMSFVEEASFLQNFDQQAGLDGYRFRQRQDDAPRMRASRLG